MGAEPETRQPRTHMWEGVDERWHAYIVVGRKSDGSVDRRHREARTREELIPKVLELEDLVDANDVPAVGRSKKFGAWLEEWITTYAPLQVRYKTLQGYKSHVSMYLIPNLGQWRLSELSKRHFALLYKELQTQNLSPGTIHLIHRTASVSLSRAIAFEEVGIKVNHAAAAREALPALKVNSVIPLDATEVDRITNVVADMRNHTRWWIAFLGARQGEVLGLKWKDVDWDAGIINIRRQLQRQNLRHGCSNPAACAKPHCITVEGCPQTCPRRHWEHGCDDPRSCARKHCERPRYPSDEARGIRLKECPPDCTGHGRGCPQRYRTKCKTASHNITCQPGCTDHARYCPQRLGGLVLMETEKDVVGERQGERRARGRKSKRELRPKSAAGLRRLPLPAVVREELRVHQMKQELERSEAGSLWNDNDLLFTDRFGNPIDPSQDWETWGEILDEADVEYIELHGARHSAATFLGSLGVDPVIRMAMLGWASPEMAKRYQHVPDAALIEAADRLGEAAFRRGPATDAATEER
jgi:integrase